MRMSANVSKYLNILRTELEDLEEHVDDLVDRCRNRQENRQITKHVSLQNIATLKNEERGLDRFVHVIDELDPDEYEGIDEMIADIRIKFHGTLTATGLVEASYAFADQKIDKVAAYVSCTHLVPLAT